MSLRLKQKAFSIGFLSSAVLAVVSLFSVSAAYLYGFIRGLGPSFSVLIDLNIVAQSLQVALIFLTGSAVLIKFLMLTQWRFALYGYNRGRARGRLSIRGGPFPPASLGFSGAFSIAVASVYLVSISTFLYFVLSGFLSVSGFAIFYASVLFYLALGGVFVVVSSSRWIRPGRLFRVARLVGVRMRRSGLLGVISIPGLAAVVSSVVLMSAFSLGYARFYSLRNSDPLCFDYGAERVIGSLIAEGNRGYIVFVADGGERSKISNSGYYAQIGKSGLKSVAQRCP